MKRLTNKVKASLVKASLIITLAVITALGAVSCSPPDLDITDYDWKKANERNDPSKSDNVGSTFFNTTNITGDADADKPEITIAFPAQSDFLRSANVEAGLKEFLSVYNFAALAADPNGNDGKASTLSDPLDYTLESAAGAAVTIKVNKSYTGVYSDLILKIDSTKYKHSGGFLMDKDGDGKAGEAGYDDVYLTKSVTGSDNALKSWSFNAPGNKSWSISLSTFSTSFTFTGTNTTSENASFNAATLNLSGITASPATVNGKAIYKAVADLVVGSIKIEKLVNGVWTDEGAAAVYDPDTSVNYISFKDFKATLGASYRVTYNGSANIETTAEYYGVKQRLYVSGAVPNTNSAPYNTAKARYALTKVSGTASTVSNATAASITSVVPFSKDANSKNVVLEVKVPFVGNPAVGLDSALINDLAKFKESFKIVRSASSISDIYTLWSSSGLTYIDITKVEGIANPVVPGSTTTAIDTLRITLDPSASFNVGQEWVEGYMDSVNMGEMQTVDDEGWIYTPVDVDNDTYDSDTTYYTDEDGTEAVASDFEVDTDDEITGFKTDGTYYTRAWGVTGSHEEFVDDWQDVWVPGGYNTVSSPGDYYYILINDSFGYTGGKVLFGSTNPAYDNFQLYPVVTP
jgi:hypothetical protein